MAKKGPARSSRPRSSSERPATHLRQVAWWGNGATEENDILKGVLDYIAEANKERGQQASLDAQTAGIWLRAVLATWSVLVRDSYRNQVVLELRK